MAKKELKATPRDEEIRRGKQAAAVLNNPLVQESFKEIADDLIKAWRYSKPDEAEKRERIWMELRGSDRWIARFARMIQTGELAEVAENQERESRNVGRSTPARQ